MCHISGGGGWYNLFTMDEGTVLNNRYQLLERLGRGGMSDVFRARDLMHERYVAIKVLGEQYSNDEAFQKRFRQEARALSTILPDERADVVWGSPQYFSPEQAVGEAPSPASDVYSLGVVLYEVLTGALPFTAPTSEELALLHLQADPIPPREYVPDIPTALEEIVLKVLSKEPSARYRTADQLGRVLLRFGTQRDIPATPALNLTPEAVTTYRQPEPPPPATVQVKSEPRPSEISFTVPEVSFSEVDWTAVGLGLLALMMVGGLVPFWIYIYFLYNPR
jgi:serine/threonine protein kinase